MKHLTKLLRRKILVGSLVATCGGLLVAMAAPVSAAPVPTASRTSASGSPATPAVTVDSHGWIHYNRALVYSLSLKNFSVVTTAGSRNQQGVCSFTEHGTVLPGSVGSYSEQVAVNPGLCQQKVAEGTLTAASVAALAARNAAATHVATSSGRAPVTATKGSATANVAAATTNTTAYNKTSFVDPVNITINSLSENLTWAYNGSVVPSASYLIVPYEFAYDGWSNSGTPHPGFNFGTGYVWIRANETFSNNDFEDLLLALSAGFPGGPALVFAVCGFSVATAVFSHSDYIEGLAGGGYNWSYSYSTSGGCTDLVTFEHHTGFGSSN
jgi:hypothetical protein